MTSFPSLPNSSATRAERIAARYPADFVWGAATAAAQIEGSVDVDGRSLSIWDTFAARPGAIRGGDTPEVADDHYRRWKEDLGIMRELGLDAYRFSIAWPRIVPAAGRVEPRGLDFYDRLLDGLLDAGIAPFATLYHWDLPQWAQDAGGWPQRDTAFRFAEYVSVVAERFGDRVAAWSTLNEPWVFAFLGHLEGSHAPGQKDEVAALAAMHHALLAHGLGVTALRQTLPGGGRIGLALSMTATEPATDDPEDEAAAHRYGLYRNWLFLHPIARGEYHPDMSRLFAGEPPVQSGDMDLISQDIDYVGINYYTRSLVRADETEPVTGAARIRIEAEYTDMGWEVYPEGLAQIVRETHERYAPAAIYVTENGSAWGDEVGADGEVRDERRLEYLARHLEAACSAAGAEVPLKGYFSWSLIDNFEWAEGYAKRFGLVHVDYDSQARTPKHSAAFYRAVIAAHRKLR